jgi:hypothetical protein
VTFGPEIIIQAPSPITVADFRTKSDTVLAINSGYGTIDTLTLLDDAVLTYGIQAPAGSGISYLAGQLFVIKISTATSIRGFPVGAGRLVCFGPDGTANLPLAHDVSWKGQQLHGASFLLVAQAGDLVSLAINQPMTVGSAIYYKPDSWPPESYNALHFWPSGGVKGGWLAKPAQFAGVKFAASYIEFDENGGVQFGTLQQDTIINGIPCLGGAPIWFNHAGKPVSFTLSATWTFGSTTFTRGQRFSGHFSLKDTITLMDPPTLSNAVHELQMNFLGEVTNKILESSSKFPFGNMGTPIMHDVSARFPDGDYISTHQEVAIPDLFTNPPFSDCDGNITADVIFRWSISYDSHTTWVNLWISRLSGGISHHVCPGTSTLEGVGAIWSAIRGIDYTIGGRASVLAKKFVSKAQISKPLESKMISKLAPLLPTHGQDAVVDPDSLKFDRVYVHSGALMLDFTYQAKLQ